MLPVSVATLAVLLSSGIYHYGGKPPQPPSSLHVNADAPVTARKHAKNSVPWHTLSLGALESLVDLVMATFSRHTLLAEACSRIAHASCHTMGQGFVSLEFECVEALRAWVGGRPIDSAEAMKLPLRYLPYSGTYVQARPQLLDSIQSYDPATAYVLLVTIARAAFSSATLTSMDATPAPRVFVPSRRGFVPAAIRTPPSSPPVHPPLSAMPKGADTALFFYCKAQVLQSTIADSPVERSDRQQQVEDLRQKLKERGILVVPEETERRLNAFVYGMIPVVELIRLPGDQGIYEINLQPSVRRPTASVGVLHQAMQTLGVSQGNVLGNFFHVLIDPNLTIYQYSVGFVDEVTQLKLKTVVLRKLLKALADANRVDMNRLIFDGSSIYSLDENPHLVGRFEQQYEMSENAEGATRGPTVFRVEIMPLRTLRPGLQVEQLAGRDPLMGSEDHEQMPEQVLNIILTRAFGAARNLKKIVRDYYDVRSPLPLPGFMARLGVRILQGFSSRIVGRPTGYLLNLGITHKVMSEETVLNRINRVVPLRAGTRLTPAQQEIIRDKICGLSITTRYNYARYTIVDVDFSQTLQSTFEMQDGSQVTYMDYYTRIVEERITVPYQPLLKSHRGKKVVFLVPELCWVNELSSQIRQELPKTCSVSPPQRLARSMAFFDALGPEGEDVLNMWGMQIDRNMTQFREKVLPGQQLFFDGRPIPVSAERGWNTEMSRITFSKYGKPLVKWIILTEDTPRAVECRNTFVARMHTLSQEMRIQCGPPRQATFPSHGSVVDVIKQQQVPDMLVVIFDDTTPQYDIVKRFCLQSGVLTQMVLASKHAREDRRKGYLLQDGNYVKTICNKLLVQMEAKMGVPAYTMSLLPPNVGKPPLMFIVGLDVFHDKRTFIRAEQRFDRAASIMGISGMFVRSDQQTMFVSGHVVHQPKTEVSDPDADDCNAVGGSLKDFIRNSCRSYGLPNLLVVFRDGVGETQLNMVMERECQQVIEAFNGAPSKPKIIYTCLLKRNPARFIMGGPNPVNPPAGTVVDDPLITARPGHEFYLNPSGCNLSTARPVRYIEIFNDSGLTLDAIEYLAFQCCHLYYGWAGTIKVPNVTFYAHKLAYHIGEHLGKNAPIEWNKLRTTLFYI
ncbi:piwi-like protein [Paratrimastix pyriformis]|uniref:Piwi-like protein n=1 Tax=Paratrimastix pyriformis TaxID=342808 RepID=A0ABQ8UHF4_9EUKA|nr:piwi-like protein [Paratrimastix pyriformis]